MKEATTTIFRAAAVRDAAPPPANAADFRPGAVAVREGRIVAVGEPDRVEKEAKHHGPVRRVDLPDRLILPAMVNAHAHLDLTDIGPVPYENAGRDFIKWIEMVMKLRPRTDEAITAAVRKGLRMSREAGVGWIGDIAGSEAAILARVKADDDHWIEGVSYLECFGIGLNAPIAAREATSRIKALRREFYPPTFWNRLRAKTWDRIDSFRKWGGLRRFGKKRVEHVAIEMQPHAPYSAGPRLYDSAGGMTAWARPTSHVAETLEEDQFIREGNGPFADLLRRLGKWDSSIRPTGLSPVKYLGQEMASVLWLFAHCSYVNDDDIKTLRLSGHSVAYCPVASDYFGHRNHRYRDILDADVNVCLGTDSIICQRSDEAQPLSILQQMRYLYRRDRTSPQTLLEMGTWRGERALFGGAAPPYYLTDGKVSASLRRCNLAKLIAIRIDPADPTDALVQALLNDNLVEPLNIPKSVL